MPAAHEIEIKFRVADPAKLIEQLQGGGFSLVTPRTHEDNSLYDFPDLRLRRSGQLLRIRKYAEKWMLTHKEDRASGRHKVRAETEIEVHDGRALATILGKLGLGVTFRYEKHRTEWSDGTGHAVLDETPIGLFAELEGPAEWIDGVAAKLGVQESEFITSSYARLFEEWKQQAGSQARFMTWEDVGRDGSGKP